MASLEGTNVTEWFVITAGVAVATVVAPGTGVAVGVVFHVRKSVPKLGVPHAARGVGVVVAAVPAHEPAISILFIIHKTEHCNHIS